MQVLLYQFRIDADPAGIVKITYDSIYRSDVVENDMDRTFAEWKDQCDDETDIEDCIQYLKNNNSCGAAVERVFVTEFPS